MTWKTPSLISLMMICLSSCSTEVSVEEAPIDDGGLGTTTESLLLTSNIDTAKSLFVTDVAILGSFPLRDVLTKLLNDAADTTHTPQDVVLAWLPTRPDGNRVAETSEANADPTLAHYQPIALVNRFDLAPANGANCGEYRVAYFDDLAADGTFIILEARLPNPTPAIGLEGCRPVAEFWANLSAVNDVTQRAQSVHSFYFNGLPGFAPVFHANHFRGGENSSGQIRVNARENTFRLWELSEYRTELTPNLRLVRTTTKDNPFDTLSGNVSSDPQAQAFQDAVINSIPTTPGTKLLADTFSGLSIDLPGSVNNDIDIGVPRDPNSTHELFIGASAAFKSRIQARLTAVGSNLTPDNIVARVQALTCASCHHLGAGLGGSFERTEFANQNIEFLNTEVQNGRFLIKPSLQDRFLPERRQILANFVGVGRPCQEESLMDESAVLVTAASSSDENSTNNAFNAIDGNPTTRWSSQFSDPQWILVDLHVRRHISRVVLNWEAAASADYEIQVGDNSDGPWHTLRRVTDGNGGLDNLTGLDGVGRFVRVFSHSRTTTFGISLWEIEVHGDPDRLCTTPFCGDGVVQSGEACDDGNTNDTDSCSNTCRVATCSDGVQNQGETGVDCGGPCNSCQNACTSIALTRVSATSSSNETSALDAPKAIDGIASTRWSSAFGDPQWISIDLGVRRFVNRVELNWEGAFSSDYSIEIADSAAGPWTHLRTGSASAASAQNLTGLAGTGRFVRMFSRARGTPWGISLFEFEVFGDNNPACVAAPSCSDGIQNQGETGVDCGGPCNACTSACQLNPLTRTAAVASSTESANLGAELAIDGNTSTRWSSAFADPQWILVNLGSVRHIGRVVLNWEAAASASYTLEVSSDGSTWSNVFTDTAANGGDDTINLNTTGKFVRMTSTQRTTPYGTSLWEFQVLGDNNVSCVP